MRHGLVPALVAALTGAAATASAATFSGECNPPGADCLRFTANLPSHGLYRLSFDLSRPGTGMFVAGATEIVEFYDKETGAYMGGDDHPVLHELPFGPPTTHGALFFKYSGPYTRDFGWYIEEGGLFGGYVSLDAQFAGTSPVSWSVTVERTGDVPEPAAWILMILGFGGAGIALRRRRRALLA